MEVTPRIIAIEAMRLYAMREKLIFNNKLALDIAREIEGARGELWNEYQVLLGLEIGAQ